MKKALILIVLGFVALGLACWLALPKAGPPVTSAPVTLPDGSTLRILAVTYGTNHVVGSSLAVAVAKLPNRLQNVLKLCLGARAIPLQSMNTSTPELMVWVDHQTNSKSAAAVPSSAYFKAYLGDGKNFISGNDVHLMDVSFGSPVEGLQFAVFPRRDAQLSLNIFYHDAKGKVSLCSTLPFANPQYRAYPDWQAETLPVTKRAQNVEAILRCLETGYGNTSSGYMKGGYVTTHSTNHRGWRESHRGGSGSETTAKLQRSLERDRRGDFRCLRQSYRLQELWRGGRWQCWL